ncbi:hypothetical protein QYF61_006990 [Mycteria americana]|uniref:Uncharacterized protein n=1 Tax=Mycteria americana TaxID=33587 RepID=A0AAN7RS30_MYCAM|nr:hypothetical protein QYF61_006990 [Mycteria americana]
MCQILLQPFPGTAFVREERKAAIIYLNLGKTFGMVSLNIPVPKLGHYSLDGQTNRWVKDQLDDEAERAAVKGSYPTWRPMGRTGALWGSTGDFSGPSAV